MCLLPHVGRDGVSGYFGGQQGRDVGLSRLADLVKPQHLGVGQVALGLVAPSDVSTVHHMRGNGAGRYVDDEVAKIAVGRSYTPRYDRERWVRDHARDLLYPLRQASQRLRHKAESLWSLLNADQHGATVDSEGCEVAGKLPVLASPALDFPLQIKEVALLQVPLHQRRAEVGLSPERQPRRRRREIDGVHPDHHARRQGQEGSTRPSLSVPPVG